MIPPFKAPSNASYFFSGFHSATTSPSFRKLRICKPSGFAPPQPKHTFRGAYFSCSDCEFIRNEFFLFHSLLVSICVVLIEEAEEAVAEDYLGKPGIRSQLGTYVKRSRTNETVIVVLLDHV